VDAGAQPKKKHKRRNPVVRRIFSVIGTLLLIAIITGSLLACFAAVYIQKVIMPETALDVGDYPLNLSSTIYYTDPVTGAVEEYEELHGDQNRVWVKYSDLPDHLVKATVALEDRRFYKHHGVDWLSTAKGALSLFTGGRVRGGSTITQQFIKNFTGRDDVTVKRKVLEIFTALEFDKKYSKEQTLEWYLNYVYFGRRCYGVYTASNMYFGKSVSDLDLAECASLIAITNNPSLYDPYTNPENNYTRRCQCLDWMYAEGYISEEERDAAKAEEIDFHQAESKDEGGTVYDWYTEQVITDVINDLVKEKGYSDTLAHDLVYSGGLKIYACVDPKVQGIVDEIYSNTENLPYTSASGQQLQSAITIVDARGNIVALSGKLGEKTVADTRGWNRATRSVRQPGSTVKPLSVYAPALEMGLITPYTVMEDSPPMLLNEKPWPSNVNQRYLGQMTVDYALANSTNTVAVRTLEMVTPRVGYEYLVDKFGVNEDHLVVSKVVDGKTNTDIGYSQMALGGTYGGLSTLDLAGAYSVFPRDGIYVEPRTYSKVEDSNHKVILESETVGEPVLKEKTTYYMNQMLQHVVTEGGGKEAAFSGMTIAGKTGSTTANNDRWFVGYTPYYTAAVWIGYDNPERVKVPNTVNPAAQMWSKVMSRVHEGLADKGFSSANGELVEVEYCKDTGKLATDACRNDARGSRVAKGWFFTEDVPQDKCDAHTYIEVCTADPILNADGEPTGRYRLAGPYCPDRDTSEGGAAKGRKSMTVLELERDYIGGVVPEDDGYLAKSVSALGYCTVHTEGWSDPVEPYDPNTFDPNDPDTWPSERQDPDFDPDDPDTWPTPDPVESTVPPETSDDPMPPPDVLTPPPVVSEPAQDDPVVPPVVTDTDVDTPPGGGEAPAAA